LIAASSLFVPVQVIASASIIKLDQLAHVGATYQRLFGRVRDGRLGIVSMDFLDEPCDFVEHIPFVAALSGMGLALPVHPLDESFICVVSAQHFFDDSMEDQYLHERLWLLEQQFATVNRLAATNKLPGDSTLHRVGPEDYASGRNSA
jgi:hypothetical protein